MDSRVLPSMAFAGIDYSDLIFQRRKLHMFQITETYNNIIEYIIYSEYSLYRELG